MKQPGNSFSNLFYFFVAGWLLWRWRESRPTIARQLAIALVFIAVGSFFLHASLTFAGEVADLTGMFFLSARLLHWNFERFYRRRVPEVGYWTLVLLSAVLMLAFGSVGVWLFQIQIAVTLALEIAMWKRGDVVDYRAAAWTALIFGVAYGLWWLDVLHGWCNPANHWISGHVLWHFLTGIAVVQIADFYSQFSPQGFSKAYVLS